jgi:hypothetical protein
MSRIADGETRKRFKECSCGRAYSRESWDRIPVAGFMQKGKDVAGEVVELKLCACGSSIAVDLGDEPDTQVGGMRVLREA